MPIILHKMNASPPARTVLIAAEILTLEIETKEVNILAKEQFTPEYLEKNPMHTIPLLEDGDFILSDSHAIIIYLFSKYGGDQSELYPGDLRERAIVHQRLFLDSSVLFPRLLAIARDDVLLGGASSVDEAKRNRVEEGYSFVEKYLEAGPFLAGKSLTIADIACVTTVSTLNVIVPIDANRFPKVHTWMEALSEEEWYRKQNQPGVDDFEIYFTTQLQKNAE